MTRSTLFLFICVPAAMGWWLYTILQTGVPRQQDPVVAILIDNSPSQEVRCKAMPLLLDRAASGLKLGNKSTLNVYTLGQPGHGWEPEQQVALAPLNHGASNFESDDLDQTLKARCEQFGVVPGSSIYRAVQVVLTQLKALGCGAPNAARCRFLVQSDADEGIERISRAKRPAELKNEGIEVFWCGTAVTTLSQGPRGAQSNALIEWWRASFSDPSIVSFAPYCPGQSQTDPAQ